MAAPPKMICLTSHVAFSFVVVPMDLQAAFIRGIPLVSSISGRELHQVLMIFFCLQEKMTSVSTLLRLYCKFSIETSISANSPSVQWKSYRWALGLCAPSNHRAALNPNLRLSCVHMGYTQTSRSCIVRPRTSIVKLLLDLCFIQALQPCVHRSGDN